MTAPPIVVRPATDLIIALFSATDEALRTTSPEAVARKFGQPVHKVEHFTRTEIERRANGGQQLQGPK
ncbi:MAG: hypothetical protein V4696_07535 [Pseudomonadota bacterium]